ncbi:MAG: hypothetical protein WA064_03915 [Candidatus Moraniibacteriota bacterium]
MKKIVTLSFVVLGVVFLAGCGQQAATTVPAAQQPTQSVTTQQFAATPVAETKIVLPIDSKEEACLAWDNLKISYGSYGPQSCYDAQDKGDYWEIRASGNGCTGCDGRINKQDGSFVDKQCFIANTCNE